MSLPTPPDTVSTTSLPLELVYRGKVRDVYRADEEHLLLVASDRVSAFDVVMAEPIPRKGEVLTQISAWWLSTHFADLDHHLVSVDPDEIAERLPALRTCRPDWAGRASLVRRTEPVLVECVVRGYLSGSAWKEYRSHGTLAGEALQPGLEESQILSSPIFSPATKAQEGHDENITFDQVVETEGQVRAHWLRETSLRIYERGRQVAADAGIILADTKFEFGVASDGRLTLIDEILTPDSSRFWPQERYQVGRGQPSLDKQPIRDWLDGLPAWNKQPPPPTLPPHVIEAASAR
ncbi:MAG: phosphoribosylaminoimidazolesuccinocarboxamide synthase [Gemmatimonadetes bacterium]|nr:phosphoribosylaminoimidazolesuccinocarboxamide synthase [Gemmatimonadota bacterium]